MNTPRSLAAAIALTFLTGCLHIEMGRQVIVDLAGDEIAIVKDERVLALLTIDGPLPKTNDVAFVISQVSLAQKGRIVLTIPDNAKARYGALVSGQVTLDFDKKLAVVSVHPSERYHSLDLNGEYPIIFDRLWKRAPDQQQRP